MDLFYTTLSHCCISILDYRQKKKWSVNDLIGSIDKGCVERALSLINYKNMLI